ncbi:MAG: accessory gene regulator B family protein [Bacteroidales bacterium]|nr:accessory gene regulator B family protein [Bacteroidales bacterium]
MPVRLTSILVSPFWQEAIAANTVEAIISFSFIAFVFLKLCLIMFCPIDNQNSKILQPRRKKIKKKLRFLKNPRNIRHKPKQTKYVYEKSKQIKKKDYQTIYSAQFL